MLSHKKLTIAIALIFFAPSVLASELVGSIVPNYKYAWGENLGWVNFHPESSGLVITDLAITGYAWSRDFGWINFSPSNGGVTNNCFGDLGGKAWSERKGWLSLSGAKINSSGKFTGLAGVAGSDSGRLNFDCANCEVRTDWRPCSSRGSNAGNLISQTEATTDSKSRWQELNRQFLALLAQFNILKAKGNSPQQLVTSYLPKEKTTNNINLKVNFVDQGRATSTVTVRPIDEQETRFTQKVEDVLSRVGWQLKILVNSLWQKLSKILRF